MSLPPLSVNAPHYFFSWSTHSWDFRQLLNTGPDDDYETALVKLDGYFEPQKTEFMRYTKFTKAKEQPQEIIDQFHTWKLCY